MEKRKGNENENISSSSNKEKWVNDSSVDYKGRTPLRASTGVWKAALLIIAIEFSERLSHFGISTNLISYMTKVMNQDLGTAAKNVNYWGGVTTILPLLGGFLADAYTGRYLMILLSTLIYLMGLTLLALSELIPSLKACNTETCETPRKLHVIVFFVAIYSLSIGAGGHKPSLESFGADQFDDNYSEERKKKMSYFNFWVIALCCGMFLGVTVIVYIQENVGWGIGFLVLAITMAFCVTTFYLGRSHYRYQLPRGSPLTPMFQVLVAALRKRKLPFPSDPSLLYEDTSFNNGGTRFLSHSNRLRFLDKAAIIEEKEEMSKEKKNNPWRLATVTKVEEMKLVLNVLPIWLTSLVVGIDVSQTTSFFVKQSATLNRKIGKNFLIPAASVNTLTAIGTIISVSIYEKFLVPKFRKITGNERGISILKRIGIGMIFAILAMLIAALVEKKRLKVAKEEKEMGMHYLSMSVFWLAPQFLILGIGDGFTLVGLQEYFYDQVPDSMRSLGIALFFSVLGIGHFLTSFLIIIVDRITGKDGKGWIGKNLNSSRLDNFYWVVVVINVVNLCLYLTVARRYTYKNVQQKTIAKDDDVEIFYN